MKQSLHWFLNVDMYAKIITEIWNLELIPTVHVIFFKIDKLAYGPWKNAVFLSTFWLDKDNYLLLIAKFTLLVIKTNDPHLLV